jgi:hypothetical protein
MPSARHDPYKTLGVRRGVSDEELHTAYRRLVKLHHPDHNPGSGDAVRRFEEVEEAYAEIRRTRRGQSSTASATRGPTFDPAVEARVAEIERQLLEAARSAREQALRAARGAAAEAAGRPADQESGRVTTDDSLTKILADARAELANHLGDLRDGPVAQRVADLIDELSSRLPGGRTPRSSG